MSCPVIVATIMRPEGDTGVQTHFRAFSNWLASKGTESKIITPFSSPWWMVYPVFAVRRLLEPLSGAASVWWYRHWHMYFLRRALRVFLRKQGPCILYVQCPVSAASALRARYSESQRVVMVTHFNVSQADEWVGKGMITHGGRLYRRIRALEERVLPELDGLVFVSEFMRREVLNRVPSAKRVPSAVIPNFLADPVTDVAGVEMMADLVCVGTLEPRKNQRYALEVIAAARTAGRNLRLSIVGDGPDKGALMDLANELGVRSQVTFHGHIKHASKLMPFHRACLHTASLESFGIALIEAMAFGLPVFAPSVGGIPDVFNDGVEGRMIPLDDADSAARMIMAWVDEPDIMARAGLAARHRFLARFESDVVASELMSFLKVRTHRS